MLNPGWLFVLASIIAVTGIVISFKQLMRKIESSIEEQSELSSREVKKEQSKFFIKVLMVESIPLVLIILGFMQIGTLTEPLEQTEVILPFALVVITLGTGIVNIFLSRMRLLADYQVAKPTENIINTITVLGIMLVGAIPIISLTAIFITVAI